MNISMNAQASASTSILPLPWSEEALRGPHALRLPFSASTPVITLAPPTIAQEDAIVEEPEEMNLGSPRSPAQRQSPRLEVPAARPLAPSQTNDESLHLALVLAFGNDKYSGAFGPTPSPPVVGPSQHQGPQPLIHRSHSTPPSYFPNRPRTPVQGKFARSPGPTPPHSPGPTPRQRDSREQQRKWTGPAPVPVTATPQRPSYEQRGTSSRSSESSEHDTPHSLQSRPRSTPPPPLDLRFESDYFSDSPTSANSSGSGLGSAQYNKGLARRSTYNLNSQPLRKPEGTVMVPIPLMLRPRPIWRTTPRSALSSPAYAPAAHLVRRSTFIAAGLDLESPVADLSAFGVETRALMFGRDAGVVLPGFDV